MFRLLRRPDLALLAANSFGGSWISEIAFPMLSPIFVCDPAFVAEMPGSRGVLLKIGHFDQVGGVTHVEL